MGSYFSSYETAEKIDLNISSINRKNNFMEIIGRNVNTDCENIKLIIWKTIDTWFSINTYLNKIYSLNDKILSVYAIKKCKINKDITDENIYIVYDLICDLTLSGPIIKNKLLKEEIINNKKYHLISIKNYDWSDTKSISIK